MWAASLWPDLAKCIQTGVVPPGYGSNSNDTDGDGVEGSADKCPNDVGPASNDGCPISDQDSDGVLGPDDDCADDPGPAWNKGCPILGASAPSKGSVKKERKWFKRGQRGCTRSALSKLAKGKPPSFRDNGGDQVANLKRCYAEGFKSIPDNWPIITFWSNAKKWKPGFDIFPPNPRPASAPPVGECFAKVRKGFNAYALPYAKADGSIYGLPLFFVLTDAVTGTNIENYRLQVGVFYPDPDKGSLAKCKRAY